jgi:hypothetical protein
VHVQNIQVGMLSDPCQGGGEGQGILANLGQGILAQLDLMKGHTGRRVRQAMRTIVADKVEVMPQGRKVQA